MAFAHFGPFISRETLSFFFSIEKHCLKALTNGFLNVPWLVFSAFIIQSLKISLTHIVLFYFTFHVNTLPQVVPQY